MKLSLFRNPNFLAAFVFCLASASPGLATTVTIGGTSSPNSGETSSNPAASVNTFDSWTLPSNYTFMGSAALVSGSMSGEYGSPAGDSTPYLSTGTGQVTMDFTAQPIDYLGFYWGSVDAYNGIELTDTLGGTSTYSGSSLVALGVLSGSSTYVNFFADAGERWSSVTLFATDNAFEFDNVATAAPEPASLIMAGLGMGMMAFGIIRRKLLTRSAKG